MIECKWKVVVAAVGLIEVGVVISEVPEAVGVAQGCGCFVSMWSCSKFILCE